MADPAAREVQHIDILVPMGGVDGRQLFDMMGRQDIGNGASFECGIAHVEMEAPDHPLHAVIEMELLENGDFDKAVTCLVAHTVGNTSRGLPELIVANACPESASALISEIEAGMMTKEGLPIGVPFVHEERLLQLVDTTLAQTQNFPNAYASFLSAHLHMTQLGLSPRWIQIVYADEFHRFPWEPGADANLYQPVAAIRERAEPMARTLS